MGTKSSSERTLSLDCSEISGNCNSDDPMAFPSICNVTQLNGGNRNGQFPFAIQNKSSQATHPYSNTSPLLSSAESSLPFGSTGIQSFAQYRPSLTSLVPAYDYREEDNIVHHKLSVSRSCHSLYASFHAILARKSRRLPHKQVYSNKDLKLYCVEEVVLVDIQRFGVGSPSFHSSSSSSSVQSSSSVNMGKSQDSQHGLLTSSESLPPFTAVLFHINATPCKPPLSMKMPNATDADQNSPECNDEVIMNCGIEVEVIDNEEHFHSYYQPLYGANDGSLTPRSNILVHRGYVLARQLDSAFSHSSIAQMGNPGDYIVYTGDCTNPYRTHSFSLMDAWSFDSICSPVDSPTESSLPMGLDMRPTSPCKYSTSSHIPKSNAKCNRRRSRSPEPPLFSRVSIMNGLLASSPRLRLSSGLFRQIVQCAIDWNHDTTLCSAVEYRTTLSHMGGISSFSLCMMRSLTQYICSQGESGALDVLTFSGNGISQLVGNNGFDKEALMVVILHLLMVCHQEHSRSLLVSSLVMLVYALKSSHILRRLLSQKQMYTILFALLVSPYIHQLQSRLVDRTIAKSIHSLILSSILCTTGSSSMVSQICHDQLPSEVFDSVLPLVHTSLSELSSIPLPSTSFNDSLKNPESDDCNVSERDFDSQCIMMWVYLLCQSAHHFLFIPSLDPSSPFYSSFKTQILPLFTVDDCSNEEIQSLTSLSPDQHKMLNHFCLTFGVDLSFSVKRSSSVSHFEF